MNFYPLVYNFINKILKTIFPIFLITLLPPGISNNFTQLSKLIILTQITQLKLIIFHQLYKQCLSLVSGFPHFTSLLNSQFTLIINKSLTSIAHCFKNNVPFKCISLNHSISIFPLPVGTDAKLLE